MVDAAWSGWRVKIFGAEEDKWRAVKAIRVVDGRSTNEGVRYVRELEALAKFSQPKYAEFFVEFFGWYEIPNYLCIAMEYCEYGDLRKYLEAVKTMPEDQVKEVASQVLGALAMMHEAGYTHRDLKPANILIKSMPPAKWWVKVCDLGLSKRAEDIAGAPTTVRGTPGFLAPETLDCDPNTGQRDSFPIDMWCFGETVYQMLTGEPVFKSYMDLFHYRAGSIEFPDQAFQRVNASPEARHFVRSLMLAHPPLRRTATAHHAYGAQAHPWMAKT
ncbi:kinase-like domain-containing protein, partial [Apiosordaria backusii]